jgi:hypothetical protein
MKAMFNSCLSLLSIWKGLFLCSRVECNPNTHHMHATDNLQQMFMSKHLLEVVFGGPLQDKLLTLSTGTNSRKVWLFFKSGVNINVLEFRLVTCNSVYIFFNWLCGSIIMLENFNSFIFFHSRWPPTKSIQTTI